MAGTVSRGATMSVSGHGVDFPDPRRHCQSRRCVAWRKIAREPQRLSWLAQFNTNFYPRDRAVRLRLLNADEAAAPRVLFEGRFRGNLNTLTPFDVSPDGRTRARHWDGAAGTHDPCGTGRGALCCVRHAAVRREAENLLTRSSGVYGRGARVSSRCRVRTAMTTASNHQRLAGRTPVPRPITPEVSRG